MKKLLAAVLLMFAVPSMAETYAVVGVGSTNQSNVVIRAGLGARLTEAIRAEATYTNFRPQTETANPALLQGGVVVASSACTKATPCDTQRDAYEVRSHGVGASALFDVASTQSMHLAARFGIFYHQTSSTFVHASYTGIPSVSREDSGVSAIYGVAVTAGNFSADITNYGSVYPMIDGSSHPLITLTVGYRMPM